MRVLLIRPPISGAKSIGLIPPLGIAYIASVLEQDNHSVRIIDWSAADVTRDSLRRMVKSFDPDVVGVSCMTPQMPDGVKIAGIVKEMSPETMVVFGGSHPTALPFETLEETLVDIVVIGEGEVTMHELCAAIEDKGNFSKVRGIAYKEERKVKVTEGRPLIKNLDSLPYPARHLLPTEKYFLATAKHSPVTALMATRGCPYVCKYCASHIIHGRQVRKRSVDNVLNEMRHTKDHYGIREIVFVDDMFTADYRWAIELCEKIIEERLDVIWSCQTGVKNVNEKLLRLMKKAGCYKIDYGVEFGSPRIQKLSQKYLTTGEIERAFRETRQTGIEAVAFFMMGYPSETKGDVLVTIELAKKLNPDYAQFSVVIPLPGSELYSECLEKGLIKAGDWRDYDYLTSCVVGTEELPAEEVIALQKTAYRRFYMRPGYVLRKLLSVRVAERIRGILFFLRHMVR